MQTDCLHCANWRISEKRKDGKTYLIAMAEHHYGLCRHFEVWDLFGFQLTAARRRLEVCHFLFRLRMPSFNSQPPEGGWHA